MTPPRSFALIDAGGTYLLSDGSPSHFNVTEMTCRCGCGFRQMDQTQIDVLEACRKVLGDAPLHVTSGCRCHKWNVEVYRRDGIDGSRSRSQHLPRTPAGVILRGSGDRVLGAARATDVVHHRLSSRRVYSILYNRAAKLGGLGIHGLGKYASFTHIDTRAAAGLATW